MWAGFAEGALYLPCESILRSFKDYLGSKLHGLVSAESQPSLC